MSDKVFTMRIKEELLEKIRISAEKNKRSIAKEIEYLLENNYDACDLQNSQKTLAERQSKIEKDLAELISYFKSTKEKGRSLCRPMNSLGITKED